MTAQPTLFQQLQDYPTGRISLHNTERGLAPADKQWLRNTIAAGSIPAHLSTVEAVIRMIPGLLHELDRARESLELVIQKGQTNE